MNMNKVFTRVCIAVLILVLPVLAGCGSSSSNKKDDKFAEDISKNTKMSKEEAKKGLEMLDGKAEPATLPKGWEPGRTGFWFGPRKNNFSPNVNVMSYDSESGVSAEDLMNQAKGQFEDVFKSPVKFVDEGTTSVGGTDAVTLEYESAMSGVKIHGIQYYVVTKKKTYVITGTGSQSDWDAQEPDLLKVMDSFDF